MELKLKSSDTDLEISFTNINGDNFTVQIISSNLNVKREVWAYTDAHGLAELFEWLANQKKPWGKKEKWESLEGEFTFSASCSSLGTVTFEIELNHYGCAEEWLVKTQISSEFGQLPTLAKQARSFFGS